MHHRRRCQQMACADLGGTDDGMWRLASSDYLDAGRGSSGAKTKFALNLQVEKQGSESRGRGENHVEPAADLVDRSRDWGRLIVFCRLDQHGGLVLSFPF